MNARSAVYYAGCVPQAIAASKIHGGMSFIWENDVHLYYRRAKADESAFGDATFHRERIASFVVDAVVDVTADTRAGIATPPATQAAR